MKKRLISMLLITVLLLSCISMSITATGGPVVSIDNITLPSTQNTTDLITVPIRTTGFIGNVTTIGIDVTFDNTKLVYDKTCALGNIPLSDNTVSLTNWVQHNDFAVTNANATGKMTFLCDNALDNPYVSAKVIPGTQDIMYNITFKRIEGAMGTADINVSLVNFDTDAYVTYTTTAGDINKTNGSITFVDVDKAALGAKITAANTLKNGLVVGTLEGQVTQQEKDNLATAIATAQAVYDDPTVLQPAVDAAVVDLQTAMGVVYNTATPTPTPDPATPTPEPLIITSSDGYISIDQETHKITYYHYKMNSTNYYTLSVIKPKFTAPSGATFQIYQSNGTTVATAMDVTNKLIVSRAGDPDVTYTFIAHILYGDVTVNGAVDAFDLTPLKKYVLSRTNYPITKPGAIIAANVNHSANGAVDAFDLTPLKKFVLSSTNYPIAAPQDFLFDGLTLAKVV